MGEVEIILVLEEGITEDPMVFASEDIAFDYFEKRVVEKGFRKRIPGESAGEYSTQFLIWEESEECPYDQMDWEIHWWMKEIEYRL